MPKILFIQPTQYGANGMPCKQKRLYLPSLAFPLLAAMTPPEWKVEVRLEVLEDIDFYSDADIVGIGTMGHASIRGLEIAEEFKKRKKTVVMGGYMASLARELVVDRVDSVIIGDAEISYPLMLKDFIERGKVNKIYDNPVNSLDGLPVPKYELLVEKSIGYMLPVSAGRGCPHTCSFCSIHCLYRGKYLSRPVPEVIRDIKKVQSLGFKQFYLIDDNIIGNPGYFLELCKAIEPLKMTWGSQCSLLIAKDQKLLDAGRKSGITMMSFGIESITQAGIDKLNKKWLKVDEHQELISRIAKAGIMVSSEMMIGTDSDTEESIKATYDFIMKTRIAVPRFYVLTPTPGTDLYKEYQRAGRLLALDITHYNGAEAVFKPENMSPEKLTELFWWLNNKVFSLKSIFLRTILNPAIFKNPIAYIFGFFVNLHYRNYIKKRIPPNIY